MCSPPQKAVSGFCIVATKEFESPFDRFVCHVLFHCVLSLELALNDLPGYGRFLVLVGQLHASGQDCWAATEIELVQVIKANKIYYPI